MHKYLDIPERLTDNEQFELLEEASKGDKEAKEKLIEHNLRLVIYIAHKFQNTNIEMEDIISIGTIGLIKAVNTFKLEKNNRFATYATRCIQNEILMGLRQNKKTKEETSMDKVIPAAKGPSASKEVTIGDTLGTEKELIEKRIENEELKKKFTIYLTTLKPNEQEIIKLRLGIDCEEKRQKDIADMFQISQSYVSRIEKKVIENFIKQEKIANE